jgi:hypothetical protein
MLGFHDRERKRERVEIDFGGFEERETPVFAAALVLGGNIPYGHPLCMIKISSIVLNTGQNQSLSCILYIYST